MKLAKVKVSKLVLGQLFTDSEGRAFGVVKGVPVGAKLISFKCHQADGTYTATFQHDDFEDLEAGKTIPWIDVQYMAYQVMPNEEPPIEAAEEENVSAAVH